MIILILRPKEFDYNVIGYFSQGVCDPLLLHPAKVITPPRPWQHISGSRHESGMLLSASHLGVF
jgi:hypothetical protein